MQGVRRVICSLTLAVCWPVLASAQQEPAPVEAGESKELSVTLLVTGEFRGQLARPFCRDERRPEQEQRRFAQHVSLREELRRGPGLDPVVLSTGDMIFPGALARFLLRRRGGPSRLVELLERMEYDAVALGNQELAPPRKEVMPFFELAHERGLPLQAANLKCETPGGAEALCELLGTAPDAAEGARDRIIERGPVRIGLVSLIDPKIREAVSGSHMRGLTVASPIETLQERIDSLRGRGAQLVVAQYHIVHARGLQEAKELAAGVEGLDVLVTSAPPVSSPAPTEKEPLQPAGYARAARTGTYIVGASQGIDYAVVADLRIEREGDRWRVRGMEATARHMAPIEPDLQTEAMILATSANFCGTWGAPVTREIELSRPFEQADFQALVLNTMRAEARAEVALINDAAIRNRDQFPLTGHLTYADVYTLLPFDNELVVVELKGEHLAKLAPLLGQKLLARGLTQGDPVKVNGRPLQAGRTYRVATNRFLAEEGDGILQKDWIQSRTYHEPEWSEGPAQINQLVAHIVGNGRHTTEAGALDPEAGFPDLARKFLWAFQGSLDTSYNRIDVVSPQVDGEAAYTQPQLGVNSTDQFHLEGKLDLNADRLNHTWNTNLLVQFAMARVDDGDPETEETFEETKDLVRLKSRYEYAGFRARRDHWWVPLPLGEVQVQTEFDPPPSRDWRSREVTGIAGASWRLTPDANVKLGLNVRRDFGDPQARTSPGINVGYTLRRSNIFEVAGTPVQLESNLDYFYNDLGTNSIHEVRNTNRLYYSLLNELFLTITVNAFAYRSAEVGQWGRNIETTIGINYLWDAAFQSF